MVETVDEADTLRATAADWLPVRGAIWLCPQICLIQGGLGEFERRTTGAAVEVRCCLMEFQEAAAMGDPGTSRR